MDEDLRTRLTDRIRSLMPGVREDLERLVRIPSVGFLGFDPATVRASAELTRELLASGGAEAVRQESSR